MAKRGTGYVSVSDFLDANQGTLDRERGDLQGYVGDEYAKAQQKADSVIASAKPGGGDYTTLPGYSDAVDAANAAQQDVTGLGTYGGVADLIARRYGATQPQAQFDAGLVGTMQGTQSPLTDYLNTSLQFATESPAPTSQPRARHEKPQQAPEAPAPVYPGMPDTSGRNPPSPDAPAYPDSPNGVPKEPWEYDYTLPGRG